MKNETCSRNSPAVDNSKDSMNTENTDGDKLVLFSGKILRKNGVLAFCGPLAQFFLTVTMGKAVWLQKVGEQEEVCVGVRVKYIRISDGSANEDVCVLGNVEKKSHDWLSNYINVRIARDIIIIKVENDIELNDGDAIRLHFSRSNTILFRYPLDSIDQEAMPLALSAV